MTKIYRIAVEMIEEGYVDVEANSKEEALDYAGEVCNEGGFEGHDSYAKIGKVLEVRDK